VHHVICKLYRLLYHIFCPHHLFVCHSSRFRLPSLECCHPLEPNIPFLWNLNLYDGSVVHRWSPKVALQNLCPTVPLPCCAVESQKGLPEIYCWLGGGHYLQTGSGNHMV